MELPLPNYKIFVPAFESCPSPIGRVEIWMPKIIQVHSDEVAVSRIVTGDFWYALIVRELLGLSLCCDCYRP